MLTKKQKNQLKAILVKCDQCLAEGRAVRQALNALKPPLTVGLFEAMFEHAKTFKPRPKKTRAVYFIQNKQFIKIGHTLDIHKRMKSLQGFNPEGLQLLGWVSEEDFTERELHERFKKYKHHREWFVASPEILGFIEENCEKPALTLETLLSQITTDNIHKEILN
jgi:hypothetical protein